MGQGLDIEWSLGSLSGREQERREEQGLVECDAKSIHIWIKEMDGNIAGLQVMWHSVNWFA